ncbi:FDLD family class I lanthipeptide [Paenibacillus faecalis]|uniref:FDLD family class I lanthipeptide n=1 Tax=Paenibacillus faecalis TaxID=2079532 RepID=UPI0018F8A037|nr:FDLD family class I lanthipeptide [Paenibacillus faecalis]
MAKNSMFDLDVQVTSVKDEVNVQAAQSRLICTPGSCSGNNCVLTTWRGCPTYGPKCDI